MSRRSPVNFVGGIYNATPPVLTDMQFTCVQFDSSGNMLVNVVAGGSGGNASVSLVGQPVPTSATAIGWDDGSGNLQFVSASNPLPIAGSITASNPSVGTIGSTAPTSATFFGVVNGSGNLEGVGASNPVRVDPTGTTIQPVEVSDGSNVVFTSAHPAYVQGTVVLGAGAALIGKVEPWDGSAILFTSGNPGYVQFGAAQHVIVDSGGGGGTQYTDLTAETAGAFIGTVALAYNGTDVVGLRTDASNNLYVNLHTAIPTGANTVGAFTSAGAASTSAATWTSSTTANTALALVSNSFSYASVAIQLVTNGAIGGGGAVIPEGSMDNSLWFPLPYQANNTGTTLSTNPSIMMGPYSLNPATAANVLLLVDTNALPYVRLRLSTAISGSNTLVIGFSVQTLDAPYITFAYIPAVGTNSSTAPNSSILAGGKTGGGNLVPFLTDANGVQSMNIANIGGSAQSVSNPLFVELTDGTNAMGAMANFGTSPTGVKALNANASLFVGTAAVTSNSSTFTSKIAVDVNILGTLGTAFSTAGKIDITAIPTGTNTIGSVKLTDGTNVETVKAASTASVAGDTAAVVALNPLSQPQVIGYIMDSTGVQRAISQAAFSSASSGAHTLVSASGSTKVYILSWWVSCGGTACNVNLQSHTTTSTTTGVVNMAANGGAVFPPNNGAWVTGAAGEAIDFNLSASQQVNGGATYCQF